LIREGCGGPWLIGRLDQLGRSRSWLRRRRAWKCSFKRRPSAWNGHQQAASAHQRERYQWHQLQNDSIWLKLTQEQKPSESKEFLVRLCSRAEALEQLAHRGRCPDVSEGMRPRRGVGHRGDGRSAQRRLTPLGRAG